MRRLGLGVFVFVTLVAGAAAEPAATPPQTIAVPLVVHVTRAADRPVATAAEVDRLVAEVNQIYQGSGVCFVVRKLVDSPRSGNLETYRDRTAFRRLLVPRALNVVLTESIRDPSTSESTARALARVGRKASGWLAGAEIEAKGKRPSRYLLVTRISGAETLAHEIGHFLGEGHHADPSNLMSYGNERRGFNDKQLRAFPNRVRREVRAGNLAKLSCPTTP